jgi:hypothetical protein
LKSDLRNQPDTVLRVLKRYIELLREDFHDRVVIGRFKQLVSQMCRGYAWRKDLCRAMTLGEQLDILRAVEDGNFKSRLEENGLTSSMHNE